GAAKPGAGAPMGVGPGVAVAAVPGRVVPAPVLPAPDIAEGAVGIAAGARIAAVAIVVPVGAIAVAAVRIGVTPAIARSDPECERTGLRANASWICAHVHLRRGGGRRGPARRNTAP